jgi:hypothetical protein
MTAPGQPWRIRANVTSSRWRAVGGHLQVEDGRLRFEPHGFDAATGGRGVDVDLRDVHEVDVAPLAGDVFGGGLRRRLRVRLRDGTDVLFVVSRVRQRVEELTAAVRDADPR